MTDGPGTTRLPKDDVPAQGTPQAGAEQTKKDSVVAQESAPRTAEAASVVVAERTGAPAPEVVDVRQGMFGAHDAGDTSGYGGLVRTVAMPAPAEGPLPGWWDLVPEVLARTLPEVGSSYDAAVEKVVVDRGEVTFFVRAPQLPTVARALRDEPELRFEMCTGVSGVHYPHETGRELHAVYHLLSITHGGRRVRLEVAVAEADPHVPSVVQVYPSVDWHERETWDMFGLVFDGHPALTRILMPDDWPGHPQRKDYPLGGIPVEYKGASVPPPDERRSYS